jgi:DNA (cytosine-5)-methyltransferase 1
MYAKIHRPATEDRMPDFDPSSRKLTAFDMFSGCGGLTEGLKAANFNVIGAVEIDDFARHNYKLNHPEVEVWPLDVRLLPVSEVRDRLKIKKGELDLLAGCPPCQGFSTLRTRNGAVSGRDRRNTLLRDFLRFVEGLKPKAIMLENVPGLESYWLFKPFCDRLTELGYKGNFKTLDASDYSVPQRRKRLIYLAGLGHEINFALAHPNKTTVREKIAGLAIPGSSGDPVHDLPENRSLEVRLRISQIPKDGGSRMQLPQESQLECHKNCDGFKDVYGRMAWDRISPTITGGCFNPSKGRFLHPDQDRAITMREAAILQGFRPDYKFSARRGKVALALMIGNALPPPFIEANAACVRDAINAREIQACQKS